MKEFFVANKMLAGIIAAALIIGGAIYFGFQGFSQTSKNSQITELQNQLASLQAQIIPLEESLDTAMSTSTATSTPASGIEPGSEPEEPEEDINPCDYLNCDNLDGWINFGSVFTCQDENDKICACQTQSYHNYSCSTLKQECVYSTTNTKIKKYNCAEPEPEPIHLSDLIVKSPGFSPAVPIEEDEMFFWVTLENRGTGDATSSLIYFKIDGVKIDEFPKTYLASDESVVVAWSAGWRAVAGEHELKVCVEFNDINNCIQTTFEVAVKPALQQPDLIIQSASISPASSTAGQALTFTAVIKNQGQVSANSSLTRLNLDLNNNGTWDAYFGAMSTRTMNIGATETEQWINSWTAVSGTHKFEVCADIDFEVAESDETNNCFSAVFVIP